MRRTTHSAQSVHMDITTSNTIIFWVTISIFTTRTRASTTVTAKTCGDENPYVIAFSEPTSIGYIMIVSSELTLKLATI